ncbi:beta-galactosidase [Aliagarivorans taiwanensis]|uniref:beta-galactosidase n=1 Tax=Aliagarivorans taiwanensis TaxID=561966 RepID=UPI0003FC688D|nr:beta-galactosidase [Aliagarivorans taiwanensis]
MRKTQLAIVLSMVLTGTYGCGSTTSDMASSQDNVSQSAAEPSFEAGSMMEKIVASHAKAKLISGEGVTKGEQALQIDFEAVSDADKYVYWPHVRLNPQGAAWNWNTKGGFTVDVTNPGDSPLNIIFKVADQTGLAGAFENQLNYAITVNPGQTENVEMVFDGTNRKMPNYWGGENLNLRAVAELQIFVQGPADEQTAIIDNFEMFNATGDFIAQSNLVVDAGPIPTIETISDFDTISAYAADRTFHSRVELVKRGDSKGLDVTFTTESEYPNVAFRAAQPWDWSDKGDINLGFDIENPTDEAIQIYVRVDQAEHNAWGGTADGVNDSMVSYMTLAPNSTSTYYMPLEQLTGDQESGMRGEPPKAGYNAKPISYSWGEANLNKDSIYTIQLFLMQPTKEHRIIVDELRLVPNLASDSSRFAGIMDEFGQFTGAEWDLKVHDEKELIADAKSELTNLGKAKPMADRSKFGGWAEGPKLEATGFFRAEKLDDQWALVDPEGHLYFMTGVDNIRMVDTYTITGVDYDDVATRSNPQVGSELRYNMFEWLPEYDSPLADAYTHVPYVHRGAMEKGEVISFYWANVMRKYQAQSKEEAEEIWDQVAIDRMVDWGFTSLGNWSDPRLFDNQRVAYVAHGWIHGRDDMARISSGNDYWWPIPDPFDPIFKEEARKTAEEVASQVDVNDPWLLGVFMDNEMSWGNTTNEASHYGIAISALSYDAEESPVKAVLVKHFKEKYQTVAALNDAWGSDVQSWDEFAESYDYRGRLSAGQKADYGDILQMISEQYFSIVQAEVKRVLPNHMYLGARFADWGQTPEVLRGAAPYVDVMSYNLYANSLETKGDWSLLPELDRPSIIGEFHFGSLDSGLFHGGIVSAANQQERGEKYVEYMRSIVDNPYFVGAHWFQYTDSPATGRAWDGENYNVGFVTVADRPYTELVEAAKQFNADLYPMAYGK